MAESEIDTGQLDMAWWSREQLDAFTGLPRNEHETEILAIRDGLAALEFIDGEETPYNRALVLFEIKRHYANSAQASKLAQPELRWQRPQLPAAIRYWPRGFSGVPELLAGFKKYLIGSLETDSCEQHFQTVVALSVAAKHASKDGFDKIFELATPDNQLALTALHVLASQMRNEDVLKEMQQRCTLVTDEPRCRVTTEGFWQNTNSDAKPLQNGAVKSVIPVLTEAIECARKVSQPTHTLLVHLEQMGIVTMAEAGVITRSDFTTRQRWYAISQALQKQGLGAECREVGQLIGQRL